MALSIRGIIEIPGSRDTSFDHAAFDPKTRRVFVAHTGVEHMVTVLDVWRELPMDKRIIMRWWQVPRHEIPTGREDRIDWLFDWWERIDTWVAENRPEEIAQ